MALLKAMILGFLMCLHMASSLRKPLVSARTHEVKSLPLESSNEIVVVDAASRHNRLNILSRFLLAHNLASPTRSAVTRSYSVLRHGGSRIGRRPPAFMAEGDDDNGDAELKDLRAEVNDLKDELHSLRRMYDDDVESLESRLTEFQDGQDREAPSIEFEGTDDEAAAAHIEALDKHVAELREEMSMSHDRALRAEAENEDLRNELAAIRSMAEEDDIECSTENNLLVDELRQQAVATEDADDEVQKLEDELKALRTLYEQDSDQVEQLSMSLQRETAANDRMAAHIDELEKELMEIKGEQLSDY